LGDATFVIEIAASPLFSNSARNFERGGRSPASTTTKLPALSADNTASRLSVSASVASRTQTTLSPPNMEKENTSSESIAGLALRAAWSQTVTAKGSSRLPPLKCVTTLRARSRTRPSLGP
jgi:hypothetical protein